jgi:cell division protein FtsB
VTRASDRPRSEPSDRPRSDPSSRLRSEPSSRARSDPSSRLRSEPSSRARSGPSSRPRSEPSSRPATKSSGRAATPSARVGTEPTGRAGPEAADCAVAATGPRRRFTPRAAILALVICSIALSLAYPVREYIAQRRQIDQLLDRRDQIGMRLRHLESARRRLNDPVYIERLARDRLHMCLPTQMCYEIIKSAPKGVSATARGTSEPWYAKLWSSVQQANEPPRAPRSRTAHQGDVTRRSGQVRRG